ncbi:MAG: hypothetical protein AAGA77_11285 [Bacteroidota bacterium]
MNNSIKLPKDVIDVVTSKKWSSFDTSILSKLFPFLDFPMVTLTDLDEIYKIHQEPFVLNEAFWNAKSSLIENSEIHLPYLDADKSVFIILSKYPGED